MQRCFGRHNISRKSILLHDVISLSDTTSYDKPDFICMLFYDFSHVQQRVMIFVPISAPNTTVRLANTTLLQAPDGYQNMMEVGASIYHASFRNWAPGSSLTGVTVLCP